MQPRPEADPQTDPLMDAATRLDLQEGRPMWEVRRKAKGRLRARLHEFLIKKAAAEERVRA